MGAGARENRGRCAGVVQEAGEKRGREVEVLKRREAGEITQSLIFRNRKRAKGSKPGKKCGSQECKAVEAEDLDPLS